LYQGLVRVDVELSRQLVTLLRAPDETLKALLIRALEALLSREMKLPETLPETLPKTLPVTAPLTPTVVTLQARKAALVARLQAMRADGLSLRAIASQLNSERVPTLSGRGHWLAGTVGNLLAE
jgi:hypothetical protein